jgi:hypothetical protein
LSRRKVSSLGHSDVMYASHALEAFHQVANERHDAARNSRKFGPLPTASERLAKP